MGEKKYSFLKTDAFSVFLILCALTTAIMVSRIAVSSEYSVNSGLLIYIAIATIIAAMLNPILTLFKIEKNKITLVSISIGVLISMVVFSISLYNQLIITWIESFSSRGGFTAVSITLLILKLAELNYTLEIEEENKNFKKFKELNEKNLKNLVNAENIRKKDLEKIKKLEEELSKEKRRDNNK